MKKALLVILDGFGHNERSDFNAIKNAKTPYLDHLKSNYAHTLLYTSGLHVGLPEGQMGNSEVGHITIGSGRVVYQDSTRIDKAIGENRFAKNDVLLDAFETAKQCGKKIHFIGLLSDGGVHSHQSHLYALLDLAKTHKLENIFVHAFMDGRDTSPSSGKRFMGDLEAEIQRLGVGSVASVSGRYFAMDRDNRWERVEKAYNAMIGQQSKAYASAAAAIENAYANGKTDEFIEPCIIDKNGSIEQGDTIICFNFRADRARQLSRVFADVQFSSFKRSISTDQFIQFTEYDANFPLPTVFGKINLTNTLGEYLSLHNKSQLRCAETEKYAHVTFFFNGGSDAVLSGEERILVDSPKVATYDLQPEMSAPIVTDKLVDAVESEKFDFIAVNYANADMVGHTGNYTAAVQAVQALDACLSKLVPKALEHNYDILITADHGNSEQMVNYETGEPFTQHTTGPVPLFYVSEHKQHLKSGGSLQDIAPSILAILGLKKPDEMTGSSLIRD